MSRVSNQLLIFHGKIRVRPNLVFCSEETTTKTIYLNVINFPFFLSGPVIKITEEDSALGILPFFKTYGMTVVMMGVLQDGGTLVTQPRFDPEQFLTAILKHKVKRNEKMSDGFV